MKMKKLMTMILSICVMVLICGGKAFAEPDESTTITLDGLVYSVEGNEVSVIECISDAESFSIQDLIDGKAVTSIGENVFMNNRNLKSIHIPDTVRSIGDYAFFGCAGLSYIDIPSELLTIGNFAFCKCDSLTAFTIPEGLTDIGSNAFYECDNLIIYVDYPSYSLFRDYFRDNNLKCRIELQPTNNSQMFNVVSASYEMDGDDTFLIMALSGSGYLEMFKGTYEQAVINDTETDNWIHGYKNDKDKYEFKIPVSDGETYIPIVSISDMYYKKYLNGQNSLERAFYPRYAKMDLEKKSLETGDPQITADLGVSSNDAENVKLSLTSASLTTTGGPNNNNFKCLLDLTMTDDTYDMVFARFAYDYDEDAETLDIEESEPIYIGEKNVFTIPVKWHETHANPNTLKNLLASPFIMGFHSVNDGCWRIYEFTVDESDSTLKSEHKKDYLIDYEYGIEGANDNKYVKITKYKGTYNTVVIPATIEGIPVTEIGLNVFEDCSSLESVVIPNNVTRIWPSAFFGCTNLKNVTLPNGLTKIEAYTFYGCSSLKNIVIPETVTSIEGQAFRNCSVLDKIEIPAGVTSIDNQVLMAVKKQKSMLLKGLMQKNT